MRSIFEVICVVTATTHFAFSPPPLRYPTSTVLDAKVIGIDLSNLSLELQAVIDRKSELWNSSAISLAVVAADRVVEVASGYADWARKEKAKPSHLFAFGSVQKMYTASAMMRLVEQGLVGLNDTIVSHIDLYIQRWNKTTLVSLFGPAILNVTVYHLLSMRSGLDDFDTSATRAYQMTTPAYDITPFDILHLCNKEFVCNPGDCGRYSSTRYVLLGFILASHAVTAWDAQPDPSYESGVIRFSTRNSSSFASTHWAIHGVLASYATENHAVAHGYQPQMSEVPWPFGGDVYNVSATAGWTCGNLLSTALDSATFARYLYGSVPRIVSAGSVAKMTQLSSLGSDSWDYGLGTMALPFSRPRSLYYGHGGSTYGFYSYVGYNFDKDFALALVTNLELDPWQMYANLNDIHAEVYQLVERSLSTSAVFV